jgi:hypothetical protein
MLSNCSPKLSFIIFQYLFEIYLFIIKHKNLRNKRIKEMFIYMRALFYLLRKLFEIKNIKVTRCK